MLDSAERSDTTVREVPADIDTALRVSDWRSRVWWPLGLAESNRLAAAQVRRTLTWVGGLDDTLERNSALLALPDILAYGRAIVLSALAASRAANARVRLLGSDPVLAFLQAGVGPLPDHSRPILPRERVTLSFARRLARVHSWSPPSRMLAAFLTPSAVAISHNTLLRRAAAQATQAIGFCHADRMLASARRRHRGASSSQHDASTLARAILGDAVPTEPFRSRAGALLEAVAKPHLATAVRDMQSLRAVHLPEVIWSGSAGLYAPRALGLEVLRRGGQVIRFDHGKPKGFVEAREFDAVVEFAASSEFVVATEGAAEITRKNSEEGLLFWMRHPRIRGSDGDPTFARIPFARSARARSGRLRVVYAPTQLLGFRQLLPVQPPDAIHLNWQIEVAETLQKLPVELICQPHPEGLFKGRPHPLEGVATTTRGDFDEQLGRADLFVFDYLSTTALWEAAACTDVPIVFLDVGAGKLTPAVAKLFRERARVIEVKHDEHNRPILDVEALRDAVLAPSSPTDPMPLRRLLAGNQT
jgi:hypothetical protein